MYTAEPAARTRRAHRFPSYHADSAGDGRFSLAADSNKWPKMSVFREGQLVVSTEQWAGGRRVTAEFWESTGGEGRKRTEFPSWNRPEIAFFTRESRRIWANPSLPSHYTFTIFTGSRRHKFRPPSIACRPRNLHMRTKTVTRRFHPCCKALTRQRISRFHASQTQGTSITTTETSSSSGRPPLPRCAAFRTESGVTDDTRRSRSSHWAKSSRVADRPSAVQTS